MPWGRCEGGGWGSPVRKRGRESVREAGARRIGGWGREAAGGRGQPRSRSEVGAPGWPWRGGAAGQNARGWLRGISGIRWL